MMLKIKNKTNLVHIKYLLFKIYLIFRPIYLWSSGKPQISDMVLVFSIVLTLSINFSNVHFVKMDLKQIKKLIILTMWIFTVNFVASLLFLGNTEFLRSTLYYLYNCAFTIYIVYLYRENTEMFVNVLISGFKISMLFQVLYIFQFQIGSRIRYIGTFNNPNQLGYFSILILSIVFFLSNYFEFKKYDIIFFVITTGILSFLSLSNAAAFSWFFLILTHFLFNNRINKTHFILVILFTFFGVFLFSEKILKILSNISGDSMLISNFIQRLKLTRIKISESTQIRGYYRITNYPKYWFLGAGEGLNPRFNQRIEFHSTLGNIQVSYGLVGTAMILNYIFSVLKNNMLYGWYPIIAILLYGFSHNGIRDSYFWMLLILFHLTETTIEGGNFERSTTSS